MVVVERKSVRILRKFGVAVFFTFLFFFLGLFGGLGYHVHQISEVSFIRNGLYADATYSIDMVCNPLLYPFYWFTGKGYVAGIYSMMYVPDGYTPAGAPFYGISAQDRYPTYILQILTWAVLPNLLVLFIIMIMVEAIGERSLYMILLCGALGFSALEIIGVAAGAAVGFLLILLFSKFWRGNPVVRSWKSLWK